MNTQERIKCFLCNKDPKEGRLIYYDHDNKKTFRLTLSCDCHLIVGKSFHNWDKHPDYIDHANKTWNNTIKAFAAEEGDWSKSN